MNKCILLFHLSSTFSFDANWNMYSKGWCDEFETGLNIIIAIIQKVLDWPSCPLAKMIPQEYVILAKEQFDHTCSFWTMAIKY